MSRAGDRFGDSLNLFLQLTGRITLASSEYYSAVQAGWEQIEPVVLDQLLTQSVELVPIEKRGNMRLTWILADVNEGYTAWRRSIGR